MTHRVCVSCKHWQFDGGVPDYSAWTPGESATMGCARGHWKVSPIMVYRIYSESHFRKIIERAATCPDFDPVVPE